MHPEADQGVVSIKENILQNKAIYLANQGKKEKALKIIQEAISLNPDYNSTSYEVYGEIFMIFGDYTEAIKQFEISKKFPFTSIETHIKLGRCYLEIGQKENALKNLEEGKYLAQHTVKKSVLNEEGAKILQDFPQTELIEQAEKYIEEIESRIFYAYIVEFTLKDGKTSYYTNYVANLYRGWKEFREEPPKEHKSVELKYFEVFSSKAEAENRSLEIEKLSKKEKEKLIESI